MPAANPISPKAIWAPIGAAALPLLILVIESLVDLVNSGSVQIPDRWSGIVYGAAAVVGALIAAYRAKDGLRLPTVTPKAIQALPNGAVLLHDAQIKLDESPTPVG